MSISVKQRQTSPKFAEVDSVAIGKLKEEGKLKVDVWSLSEKPRKQKAEPLCAALIDDLVNPFEYMWTIFREMLCIFEILSLLHIQNAGCYANTGLVCRCIESASAERFALKSPFGAA